MNPRELSGCQGLKEIAMTRKEVMSALGVLSGAALLTVSMPSYSEDTHATEGTPQMNLMVDEKAPQIPLAPQDETTQAESEADSMSGVAGRKADDMAGEGPAGPGQNYQEDRPGEK
jgi:hypothetical protein